MFLIRGWYFAIFGGTAIIEGVLCLWVQVQEKNAWRKYRSYWVIRHRFELKCLQKFVVWPFGTCECHMSAHYKHRRWGQGISSPPKLSINLFYSVQFSERMIGTSGRMFTECLHPPKSYILLCIWCSYILGAVWCLYVPSWKFLGVEVSARNRYKIIQTMLCTVNELMFELG